MKTNKLPNYLYTNRKRLGLNQHEMAQVLGWEDGATVSRYERGERLPSLKTALAYQVIFNLPPHKLFAGIYQEVKSVTEERARRVADKLSQSL